MKSKLAYATMFLLLGGCASVQTPPTPSVRTVQVLENTGTEFPTMCMLLQSDGSLLFKGGFDFYNPGAWRRDGDILTVSLGGKAPFAAELYKEQLSKHAGSLSGYNEKRRELSYHFAPSTESVGFDGFYFYRAASCHAQ
ncbi:hypothetical protein [Duganella callida]|uniref:Lipoprotein n=1 Tax=Duganella callida TaxID=2561932 RepID=A0A4Y9SG32_9BURK|nr:hypothetical protein [Duganella callida]TFW22271.1 hypothetical protein E4L98_12330 [Duganella callida]